MEESYIPRSGTPLREGRPLQQLGHRLWRGSRHWREKLKLMYTTYIIQSVKNKHYYIGSTSDVNKRIFCHNADKNRSTKNKGPWKLVYSENFVDRKSAWLREKQIKNYKGGEAFRKLIKLIKQLSSGGVV